MQPRIYLLTALLLLMSLVVIFLWVGFAYANRPYDWPVSHVGRITCVVGWPLFTGGWVVMLAALVRLGVRRSHGLRVTSLQETGVYCLTRNPQVVAFLVAMLGYFLLWPGWRSLGSLIVVGILSHLMARTEEEHLLKCSVRTTRSIPGRSPGTSALRDECRSNRVALPAESWLAPAGPLR